MPPGCRGCVACHLACCALSDTHSRAKRRRSFAILHQINRCTSLTFDDGSMCDALASRASWTKHRADHADSATASAAADGSSVLVLNDRGQRQLAHDRATLPPTVQ